jgi:chaperonin GroEL
MSNNPGITQQEHQYLQRRQAVLSGGIAVIRVGGSTDLELRERKDRIDDAICATRAATRSGIVEGGGFALIRASNKVAKLDHDIVDKDVLAGWNLLLSAATSPAQQIVSNAGYVPEIIMAKLLEDPTAGFNSRTGEWVNLRETGVIDPLLVVESALIHASSAAMNLLSVGCAIANE